MKKDLIMFQGKIDRSKFFRFLCIERYRPENIQEMEQLRWERVQRHRTVILEKWRYIFRQLPMGGSFFGTHHRWDNTKQAYKDHIVLFSTDGYGISNKYVTEKDYGKDFVRCLDQRQLPKYLNSKSAEVQDAVKERMKGNEEYAPYTKRQDLVDLYYRVELESSRVHKAIGYYDLIIKDHYDNMVHRIVNKSGYDQPLVSISINNRVYVFKDGKLIIPPEQANFVFFEKDFGDASPVRTDHGMRYHFGINEREQTGK